MPSLEGVVQRPMLALEGAVPRPMPSLKSVQRPKSA
jgi:hypothetical protein